MAIVSKILPIEDNSKIFTVKKPKTTLKGIAKCLNMAKQNEFLLFREQSSAGENGDI